MGLACCVYADNDVNKKLTVDVLQPSLAPPDPIVVTASSRENSTCPEKMMTQHRDMLQGCGLQLQTLTNDLPLFDLNLHIDPDRASNLVAYCLMCQRISLMVTISCFTLWGQNKKANAYGKVVPAFPTNLSSYQANGSKTRADLLRESAMSRFFFFDDNLNLEQGGETQQGICNLRNPLTGEFVDFNEGRCGFKRDTAGKHTLLHYSTDYRVVLVQANILDAMTEDNYFEDILSRFSEPGEKLVVAIDVNSTIVCVDTVSGKDVSQILLGTMCEFLEIQTDKNAPFEVVWEDRKPVKVEKPMTFKQVVKKIAADDTDYYQSFYTESRCEALFGIIAAKAGVKWISKNKEPATLPYSEFHAQYKEYLATMLGNTTESGITKSWFSGWQYLRDNRHPCILNSFGVDTKKVLAKTVARPSDVMHITVNHDSWDAKDKSKFEKEYGITCQRRSTKEAEEQAKNLRNSTGK